MNELDSLALSAHQQWKFLDLQPGTPVELRTLGSSIHVAHPTCLESAIALARAADAFTDSTGCYMVPNVIEASRYAPDRWHLASKGCTSRADVKARRVIYVDCDSIHPTGTNATNEEKACAVRLASRVEQWLCSKVDPWCVGRGDSGNGASLFIAIEPTPSTPELDERIADLLRRLAAAFVEQGAKVDTSVSNPDRLVPMFGTMKRKGPHTADRPHRQTFFSCRGEVRRIPIARIL